MMSGSPALHFDPQSVHPESIFYAPDGRLVQFKVHSANWDPALPENSLDALAACLQAPVARAEIDIVPLATATFCCITTASSIVARPAAAPSPD